MSGAAIYVGSRASRTATDGRAAKDSTDRAAIAGHARGGQGRIARRRPPPVKPDAVIIGAGFAGLSAATAGEIRHPYQYVADLLPTLLELAHVERPSERAGRPAQPIDGVSFAYTFDDAAAKGRRTTQYFELGVNRGLYHDGWMASSLSFPPWQPVREGFDPEFGARPMRRTIQRQVENRLSRLLLDGGLAEGDSIRVDVKDDQLHFRGDRGRFRSSAGSGVGTTERASDARIPGGSTAGPDDSPRGAVSPARAERRLPDRPARSDPRHSAG